MGNERLHHAKRGKNDEFYTRYEDIAEEVQHYKQHFKGKHVLLNANDAKHSCFWDYFNDHFVEYGLASLTATSYGEGAFKRVRDSAGTHETPLQGDGDFRSEECVELLKQSDIVVTNPPFSLFREYIAQLVEYGKKFLVIGNTNAITYKEIWPLIQGGLLWLGSTSFNKGMYFGVSPDWEYSTTYNFPREINGVQVCRVSSICWFTNLDHAKRHEELPLWKKYTQEEYSRYDNYDAIEVGRVANIPKDYDGVMGVPITFLGKHNPEQFEIVKFRHGNDGKDLAIGGRTPYFRILIRRATDF